MKINVLTVDEFIQMKLELINEIKETISKDSSKQTASWLRTSDVCKILKISNSSVQNLRNSGILKYSKIKGTIFYKTKDVEDLMEANRKNN
jgi:hypothetical protein